MHAMTRTTYILLIILFLVILLALTACAPPAPLIKTINVPVTKYVRQSIDQGLLKQCIVVEPDRACWRDGKRVLCNGQLVEMLVEYRAALALCDTHVRAIDKINGAGR